MLSMSGNIVGQRLVPEQQLLHRNHRRITLAAGEFRYDSL